MLEDASTPPSPNRPHRFARGRFLLQLLIGLVVVAVAYLVVLPMFGDYREVWPTLSSISASGLALLAVFGTMNLIAPATSQSAALPGLGLRRAVTSDWATSALTNTVPGGSALAIALTWTMYRSWSLDRVDIGRAVVVTGIWDSVVKLGTPAIALAWLATQRPIDRLLVQAAVIGLGLLAIAVVLIAVALGSGTATSAIGRLLDRMPFGREDWAERASRLRADTVTLLRARGPALTVWTLVGHLNLFVLLLVCLRAVGVPSSDLTAAAILAAFAFGRLVTAVPLTPGGMGVMEVGLAASLGLSGTAEDASILTAVLLFRFLSFAVPIPLGLVSWFAWSATRDRKTVHD